MSREKVQELLKPSPAETFENAVEASIDWTVKKSRDLRKLSREHPRFTVASVISAIGLWATLQFGIPYAINKYHESRAEKDIQVAETRLFDLMKEESTTFENFKNNKFIIPDQKEDILEQKLNTTTNKFKGWKESVNDAKTSFSKKEFLVIRKKFEDSSSHHSSHIQEHHLLQKHCITRSAFV